MQPPARNQLAIFSKFRQELGCDEDKIVFCLEHSCLSAKDSLKKIQTFAEDLYQNKEIIFIEHVGTNHFQIQKKERNSWDLTRKDVYGDGRCGIVSTMVALKELELITNDEFNKYIDHRSGFNKLKDAFCERGTQKNRDELVEFLCRDIKHPTTKLIHQNKISTLLSNPRRENWLDSDTIKEVLASKTNANIKIFGQNTQHVANFDNHEEALLLKIKDTKFEVATVLLGLLAQKFQHRTTINIATDLTKLFEGEDPQLKIKLGFPEGRKVEFSDIFPIAESREKVRCFYTDNSDNVSNFLATFDQLNFNEATLTVSHPNRLEFVKLFKNVGLLIHQIDHIKKTQPYYLGITDVTKSKKGWDDLADRILQSNLPTDAELKKDITAIRERWRVGENEERLVGTIEKAKKTTKTKPMSILGFQSPDFVDDEILIDLTENFKRLKNSGSIPDKEIFLSTCQFVDSQASNLKGKDEFLKSFADFFFYSLENFHAQRDMETTKLALDSLKKINFKLNPEGRGGFNLEDYLENLDKRHYQAQINNPVDQYIIKPPTHKAPNEKLKKLSSSLLNMGDNYLNTLFDGLEAHFKKDKSFSEKIKGLPDLLKNMKTDDKIITVLDTLFSSFSDPDLPLIPDFLKPTPDNSFSGWGRTIEIIETENSKDFSLTLDGKEIKEIIIDNANKLEEFKKLPREELAMEITNFFRTASKDIKINYTNNTSEDLVIGNREEISFDKKNNKFIKSKIDRNRNFELFKEKLASLSQHSIKPTSTPTSPNLIEQLDLMNRSDSPSFPHPGRPEPVLIRSC